MLGSAPESGSGRSTRSNQLTAPRAALTHDRWQPWDLDRAARVSLYSPPPIQTGQPTVAIGSPSNRPDEVNRDRPYPILRCGHGARDLRLGSTHSGTSGSRPFLSLAGGAAGTAGHLLPPPLRACACARAWAGQAQWEVTSVTTFKRLPLRALIARRAAAPEIAIVSPFPASPVHGRGMDLGPP